MFNTVEAGVPLSVCLSVCQDGWLLLISVLLPTYLANDKTEVVLTKAPCLHFPLLYAHISSYNQPCIHTPYIPIYISHTHYVIHSHQHNNKNYYNNNNNYYYYYYTHMYTYTQSARPDRQAGSLWWGHG